MINIARLFSGILKAVGALLIVVLILSVIVIRLEIPISLDLTRSVVESAVREALGRDFVIEGPIDLVPSLSPRLEIERLRLANPPGWEAQDFARVKRIRVQLEAIPLLRGKIHIHEAIANGVEIFAETQPDGKSNWQFDLPDTAHDRSAELPSMALAEVRRLSLKHLNVSYHDGSAEQQYEIGVDELHGAAAAGQPLDFRVQGSLQQQPFSAALTGGSITQLFAAEQPWPLEFEAEIGDASLEVSGVLTEPKQAKGIDLAFRLSAPGLEVLEGFTESPLPRVGSYDLRGTLRNSESTYSLSALTATIGHTTLTGHLELNLSGDRPRVGGALAIATLDMAPFLTVAPAEKSGTSSAARADPLEQRFSLEVLQHIAVELDLGVNRVVNAPLDIADVSLEVSIQDGTLSMPLAANLTGVPINGALHAKTVDGAPTLAVELSAERADIGDLAGLLMSSAGIAGRVEQFECRLAAQGSTVQSLLAQLSLQAKLSGATLTYGEDAGGEPVHLRLDTMEISALEEQPLALKFKGTLIDQDFSVDLSGDRLATLIEESSWSLRLNARGAGARLQVEGAVAMDPGKGPTDLQLNLVGRRLGDLASWLGVSPSADFAYTLRGRLRMTDDETRLSVQEAKVGRSAFSGDFAWKGVTMDPLFLAALHFKAVDTAELSRVIEVDQPTADGSPESFDLDLPILPREVYIDDADIDLTIDRVFLEPADLTNVTLSSRFRDGRVQPSRFRATIGDASFSGELSLDLRGKVPTANAKLVAKRVDYGALLYSLRLAEGLEAEARRLEVNISARGSSLLELLDQTGFSVVLQDGLWTLRDPNTQDSVQIRIREGTTTGARGVRHMAWTLEGQLDDTPIKITGRTDPLADPADAGLALRLAAESAKSRLELSGSVILPIERNDFDFKMSLSGERLDLLNPLIGLTLPPLGPYTVTGRLCLVDEVYRLSGLEARVGDSDVSGHVSLDTTGIRPRVDIDLASKTLQLEDLGIVGEPSEEPHSPAVTTPTAQEAADKANATQPLAEQLRGFDGRLSLRVAQVLSGDDSLGGVSLGATLEDGRLWATPLKLETAQGSASATFGLEASEFDVAAMIRARVDQLEAGPLLRLLDPITDARGRFSLDMDVTSFIQDLDDLMQHANGRLDYAIWPEDFRADVVGLWAINAVTSILPILDPRGSKVNCLVGRFNLDDGVMRSEEFFMDTTQVRVKGKGEMNFKTETLDFKLNPRAKYFNVVSVPAPARVKGKFSDFALGVQATDIVKEVGRRIPAYIFLIPTLLFDLLMGAPPTVDEAACIAAYQRPEKLPDLSTPASEDRFTFDEFIPNLIN